VLKIARILRDYCEAGSVNSLLALWGFVDETTFLTKAGHVGVVYRVRGVRLRRAHARPARRSGPSVRGRAPTARRSLSCLPVPPQADDRIRSSPHRVRNRSRTRRFRSERPTLNSRRSDLYEFALYFVVLYEAPTGARTSTTAAERLACTEGCGARLAVHA